jgi:hypothetical protein
VDCIVWLVAVVVGGALIAIVLHVSTDQARKAYYAELEKLKNDPHNPNLREHVLALGRKYAAALRNTGRQTVFDEVALLNDVNAACARAGQRVIIEAGPVNLSAEQRLKQLEELRAKNLITEGEYQSRRQEVLKGL